MKKLLVSVMFLLISAVSFAIPKDARLIADETWIAQTKTSVKIITSNPSIKSRLMGTDFKTMSQVIKKDRRGEYIEYSFTYKKETFKMPLL